MRILLVHNYYQQTGGEDRVFDLEGQLLESKGHRIHRCIMDNESINQMGKIEIGLKTIWNKDGYDLINHQIKNFKPDIVHFHNIFPLISPAGYEAAYQNGIPVIQTLHNFRLLCLNATFIRDGKLCEKCLGLTPPIPGVIHRCYHQGYLSSATVAMMLTIHRMRKTWINRVNAFIVLSEFSKQKFLQAGYPNRMFYVKSNFAIPNSENDSDVEDRKYFLFIGRLSQEKGIKYLLQSMQEIDVPIKIVGTGPLETEVKKITDSLHYCEFLGQVSHDKVIQLIQKAIAIVIPSIWYEGFPMIIAEAFSQKTPMIASRLGVMEEIFDNGKYGLDFLPADSRSLSEAIKYAWLHLSEMREYGENCYRLYIEKYSPEASYHSLVQIYNNAITTSK